MRRFHLLAHQPRPKAHQARLFTPIHPTSSSGSTRKDSGADIKCRGADEGVTARVGTRINKTEEHTDSSIGGTGGMQRWSWTVVVPEIMERGGRAERYEG